MIDRRFAIEAGVPSSLCLEVSKATVFLSICAIAELVALSVACAALVSATAVSAQDAAVRLDTSRMPQAGRVDPRFQSYNIEMAEIVGGRFWAPYGEAGKAGAARETSSKGSLGFDAGLFRQRPPVDLSSVRLRNLARGLGPAYIRVSGSWANKVFFQDDDLPRVSSPPNGFDNVLTRQQWAGVVDFAKAVDGRLTTSFAVSTGARDAAGNWSANEARKLLRYTTALGGRVHSAELINEPNLGVVSGLPAGYNAESFARDIAAFREFVKGEVPYLKTVGPGSTGETGVALFNSRGLSTETMLNAEPRPSFDYFSYHFYGGRSQRCAKMAPTSGILGGDALGEEWLARTDKAFKFYKDLRDRYMPGAPIWLNETAQASCGGDKWAASFLDTFRYIDQMGRLAKQGVSVIMHNTLAASDYGLIDEETTTPRPSYWAALLWHRLMGDVVLDAEATRPELHVYAHCLRGRPGGVGIAVINFNRTRASTVVLPIGSERYSLSADNLEGKSVKLNDKPLAMKGDRLPPITGSKTGTEDVTLPPVSITFLGVPTAGNPACQ